MRTARWPAALAAALALAACGGSKESPPPPPNGSFTLSGTVTYDSVPPTEFNGLNYAATLQKPVRGAVVEVVAGSPAATLASATTSDAGAYTIAWTGTSAVSLRVKAQTLSPPMRVQDDYNGNALYALDSGPVDASATATLNLNAASGWTGSFYGAPRSAAPFAILDAMLSAAKAFLAVAPATAFPALSANWSVSNGQGTYYDPTSGELTILGQAGADTDEYDTHVVVHEWGHYFEDQLSRADSPGGSHGVGDLKDPRLAFSEGWGNALGAMVFYPDDLYADTMWNGGQATTGIAFHLEPNGADDPTPGWWSEMSVAHFLYDVFDSPASDDDPLALGLGPISDVLTGPQRVTPAFTTLFSFVDALKGVQPGSATAIDAMLSGRNIASPVQDAWGTGETHDGGFSSNLPVYQSLAVGGGTTVGFLPSFAPNDLASNRFVRFPGTGGTVTITAGSSSVDVALEVWHAGQLLQSADVFALGQETIANLPTAANETYLVIVTGLQVTGAAYTVPVTVTSP
jgi:hypothetical protein